MYDASPRDYLTFCFVFFYYRHRVQREGLGGGGWGGGLRRRIDLKLFEIEATGAPLLLASNSSASDRGGARKRN
jgi:hypothetical protein